MMNDGPQESFLDWFGFANLSRTDGFVSQLPRTCGTRPARAASCCSSFLASTARPLSSAAAALALPISASVEQRTASAAELVVAEPQYRLSYLLNETASPAWSNSMLRGRKRSQYTGTETIERAWMKRLGDPSLDEGTAGWPPRLNYCKRKPAAN